MFQIVNCIFGDAPSALCLMFVMRSVLVTCGYVFFVFFTLVSPCCHFLSDFLAFCFNVVQLCKLKFQSDQKKIRSRVLGSSDNCKKRAFRWGRKKF